MESTKYTCIFDVSKSCPAKTAWKLTPESLVEFCKICIEKTKYDILSKALELFATIQMKAHPNLEAEKLRMEHEMKLDIELENTRQKKVA